MCIRDSPAVSAAVAPLPPCACRGSDRGSHARRSATVKRGIGEDQWAMICVYRARGLLYF
eukprot:10614582-Alexandrium_andersonii.AAC.1